MKRDRNLKVVLIAFAFAYFVISVYEFIQFMT